MDGASTSRESSTRPLSRRGLRVENTPTPPLPPSSLSNNVRPGTSGTFYRGMSAVRPPSGIRVGTASRIASALSSGGQSMGANSGRISTAIGFAGSMMTERPITQHGLSGLPTSYGKVGTASGMRMVKDKRYWQAVLQTKMNEITQEIGKLMNEKTNMDREQSAKRMYEKKVKEAAKELTELQAQLTDMNIALDSFSSGTTRQHLQREAAALRERNESAQNQLEALFGERQMKDERNKQLEQEIEIEKNKINDMILSLPIEEQARYNELQEMAEDLKRQNVEMQTKVESLINQKERLNAVMMGSQSRMEAARLKQKLRELTINRDTLREEEENKLTPEQERDKLIKEVRADNQALTSIGHQMKIIEDQLNEKKEQLQLIEQTLEEGDSERHAKYKELRRRDETMTDFLETFPQQMEEEKRNMELLKNQISYAIEQITLQGMNTTSFGLSNPDLMDEKNDLTSQSGLLKEYKRLGIQLKQLQILEKRTSSQLKQLQEEEATLMNEIRKYSNLDTLRSEAAENYEELSAKLEELRRKKKLTEDVVMEAKKRNQEIKDHLRNNETYRQISHLEEKFIELMRENKTLQEVIDENRQINDYTKTRTEVEQIVNEINKMLIEDRKASAEKFKKFRK